MDKYSGLIQSLVKRGYCVARGALDAKTIDYLQRFSQGIVGTISADHRRQNKSQGSLINLSDYPDYAAIIGHQALADLFAKLAFANPVFSSGYLISKPPHSPALFWHQDWWGWDDELSYTAVIAQVFIMIYLTETTPENGCLRVIPGSHRRPHSLHDATAAHAQSLSEVEDPADPLYHSVADEIAVVVEPGDVVIGDARILHGAYANNSDSERMLLTLWYHPDFLTLPVGMQARIQEIFLRRGVDTDPATEDRLIMSEWPLEQRQMIEHLFPNLEIAAQPHAWNRQPDFDAMLLD